MIQITQLKPGIVIRLEGKLLAVIQYDHVKPGKGAAFVRTKMKNLENGNILERTFRSSDKLDDVFIDEKTLQFLYNAGETLHFMDTQTYEELIIPKSVIEDSFRFLKENMEVSAVYHEHRLVTVTMPISVELVVTQADPGIKGDTAKSGTKQAIVETGATVQVPLFIQPGDKIKIDTRTGNYTERVSS